MENSIIIIPELQKAFVKAIKEDREDDPGTIKRYETIQKDPTKINRIDADMFPLIDSQFNRTGFVEVKREARKILDEKVTIVVLRHPDKEADTMIHSGLATGYVAAGHEWVYYEIQL